MRGWCAVEQGRIQTRQMGDLPFQTVEFRDHLRIPNPLFNALEVGFDFAGEIQSTATRARRKRVLAGIATQLV